MNFLKIPEEVIEGNILPFLDWNDLLRFRRVCKTTNVITNAYLRVNPDLAPELEINEKEKSFEAFLKMNIPTTRLFLNNISGDEFYQRGGKNMAKFMKKCGPLIKHLRVRQFSLYPYGKEWDFYDALINLKSVEAAHFGVGGEITSPEELSRATKEKLLRAKQEPRFLNNHVPNVFKQLDKLRIGQKKGLIIGNVTNRTGGFLEKGLELEHVSLPFNSCMATTSTYTVPQHLNQQRVMAMAFLYIDAAIKDRAEKFPGKPNLKEFDFTCYHDEVGVNAAQMEWTGSQVFLELLATCIKYDVKLMNVGPFWFQQRETLPQFASPELGRPVVSMVGLHPCVFPVNLCNLERVEIRATSRSSAGSNWREERPNWPNLKSLDITVDSKHVQCSQWNNGEPNSLFMLDTKILFQFFFLDISRPRVTELCLNFVKDAGSVAVPKTEDIVASCPNLKKLTIINWPGTNKALTKLWAGLPALEEISLEGCKDLGNVAFVGEDARSPVFFKLTKLNKLSLKNLDRMPKISDTVFSLVFRHLKISHLVFTSDSPVKSITPTGILSLLEGNFAFSIEKFSFREWSMANVNSEKFGKLEEEFRSHKML